MTIWLMVAAFVVTPSGGRIGEQDQPPKTGTTNVAANELANQPLENLLSLLINRDPKLKQQAFRELTRRRDPRSVSGLIELLRFPASIEGVEIDYLLRNLTGQRFEKNWIEWASWLTAKEKVELPPLFLEWKAALFAGLVDPNFNRFLFAGMPLRIRIEEIAWGGVKKDGIPALDNPKQIPAAEAAYLKSGELVFGVELNGDARAYPLRMMNVHEMLNDVIGGTAVSLAYCTMCRSGVLFETTVDGRTFTFGSSGLLYRSNKLMYDRQTESLWLTMPREPISGKLANSGIRLKLLPVVVTTWQEWRDKHPTTKALSPDTGFKRDYSEGAVYADYFNSDALWFPVPRLDNRLKPKEEVFALIVNGQPKAYPLKRLSQLRVLNDTLGGQKIVLISDGKPGGVRAYERGDAEFKIGKSGVVTPDGREWQVTESALVEKVSAENLPRLAGHTAYWFGWTSFYPQTALHKQ
ncbi:MAG: DUF3179 domain-containing protein [Blastocatellia bacterium]